MYFSPLKSQKHLENFLKKWKIEQQKYHFNRCPWNQGGPEVPPGGPPSLYMKKNLASRIDFLAMWSKKKLKNIKWKMTPADPPPAPCEWKFPLYFLFFFWTLPLLLLIHIQFGCLVCKCCQLGFIHNWYWSPILLCFGLIFTFTRIRFISYWILTFTFHERRVVITLSVNPKLYLQQ